MPRNLEKNAVSRGDAALVGRQKTMAWTLKKKKRNIMNGGVFKKKKFYLVVRKETVGKRNKRESR